MLEQKNAELQTLLESVEESRETIRRQNDQLMALATIDPLTGCLNRRAFVEEVDRQWSSARRYGHGLSCLMFDVDRFKSINDGHGHHFGDQVLQNLGRLLVTETRESDIVCRYGGEEFCILMPHLDVEEAAKSAERIRAKIESTRLANLRATVSIGVSSLEGGAGKWLDLVEQADQALYAAKWTGRNRVVRHDRMPEEFSATIDDSTGRASPIESFESPPIPYHAVASLVSALAHRRRRHRGP